MKIDLGPPPVIEEGIECAGNDVPVSTPYIDPILAQCEAHVLDAGPTLRQRFTKAIYRRGCAEKTDPGNGRTWQVYPGEAMSPLPSIIPDPRFKGRGSYLAHYY